VPEHDAVTELIEIGRIRRLKARYCLYMDTKRWDLWRELFTEDLRVEGTKQPPEATRDTFVDGVRAALEGVQTAHQVHEPIIELAGERSARGVWPMYDDLRFPDGHPWAEGFGRRVGYGHYEEEYRKDGDVWRISVLRLVRLFVWREADHPPVTGGVPSDGAAWLAGGGAPR
jgi:hypothetical protein